MPRAKKTAEEAPAEQAEAEQAPAAGQYLVVWHVKVDGRRYAPGDRVSVPEDIAARLLAVGAIATATE